MKRVGAIMFFLATGLSACTDSKPAGSAESSLFAYADRFEYAGERYASLDELRPALEAGLAQSGEPQIALSTCIDQERAASLMRLTRELGFERLLISAFEEECD